MSRRIVKVQLPVAGTGPPAILIYDEDRKFEVMVMEPVSFENILIAQGSDLKAYWFAEIDDALRTFKLTERAPEQDW
jgi:hypothetical protein